MANLGHKQTPRVETTVGQLLITTEPRPEHSFYLQRYDLCLHLRGTDGATHSEWEGVTNLLLQLQAIDDTTEVWPWAVKDQHQHNPPIAITTIARSFFDLQLYVPGLASTNVTLRTRLEMGDTRHPTLLLRSSVAPTQLVEKWDRG